ncbi:hypothetical protein GCU60_14740 [Blastococcus saxobsidens]|uniref:Uncharacterized protein n=1 Tax=Blastococcus saxobsidens TaxID=138336 RepID=A0A6L9W5E0_9ACTN|nr:hypothetical protein [Blastococcus saxobsidens]NEK86999.1 hypothetical protein [Blastococcus saxobsidens]
MTLVVPPSSGPAAEDPAAPVDAEGLLPAVGRDEAADDAVVGAVDRLRSEFSGRVGPHVLVRVVRDCRRELGGSPVGAMPELVERLARYRLDRHIG